MRAPADANPFDELRLAIAGDPDPTHQVSHAATLRLLDRSEVGGRNEAAAAWAALAGAARTLVGTDGWSVTLGVTANLIALVDLGDPDDFATVRELVERHGHGEVARVQATADRLLRAGRHLPLATHAVRVLSDRKAIAAKLARAGHPTARETADVCFRSSVWLVLADVPAPEPDAHLARAEEIPRMWEHGGIVDWRAQAAIIADNPWAPSAKALEELALTASGAALATAVDQAVTFYRERTERREKEHVAREIRRLVAVSGLSQRQFAAMAGTSASRLSTYVNALVTPSATMMVRIRRISALAQGKASGLATTPR